ncbi:MAG: putative toxin-antitoxin system toxin component, PIN family [Chloroflexota bacterium]
MPLAVLDTNVLVSALITPSGASARLLLELRAGTFELVVSPLLLAELREVLGRKKLRRYVTTAEADAYVEFIRRDSIVLDDPAPTDAGPLSADPEDQFLIDLARAAPVDALVSGDRHLLDLRREAPIVTPAEFLASLGDD